MNNAHTRRDFLKVAGLGAAALALPISLRAADDKRKPNIIYIMADDLGYGDLSCYGNTDIKTRNIDRLATEGIRLTQFYTNSPICSPSRVAITTGQYPGRHRVAPCVRERNDLEVGVDFVAKRPYPACEGILWFQRDLPDRPYVEEHLSRTVRCDLAVHR